MEVFVKIIMCLFIAISGFIIGRAEELVDNEETIIAEVIATIGFVMFTIIILII